MLRIFAKHGTSEKVLIFCPNLETPRIQSMLESQFVGSWVYVEPFSITNEFIHFDDGLVYQGFHGRDERYCASIKKQKPCH